MIKINKQKGFTLVESLVAISILVMAITGATSAIQSGISSYIFSKDQIIAFYLAQEGFEQIRNIRDENSLSDRHWLAGLAEDSDDPCYFGEACYVDPVNSTQAIRCELGPGQCPVLRQDDTNGFFGYDVSWSPTIFTRDITLSSVDDDELTITVEVTWSKGIVSRSFTAKENIMNWNSYE
ncbi:MAG: prepilin-type N-terminal cleavage/methylation domain-containing protein [Parcubacteria group bacterium]